MEVPRYSLTERDRRWALSRQITAAENVQALIAYGGPGCASRRLAALGLPVLVIFGVKDQRWRSSSATAYRVVPGARVELSPASAATTRANPAAGSRCTLPCHDRAPVAALASADHLFAGGSRGSSVALQCRPLGGSVRGYHELLTSLAAQRRPATARRTLSRLDFYASPPTSRTHYSAAMRCVEHRASAVTRPGGARIYVRSRSGRRSRRASASTPGTDRGA